MLDWYSALEALKNTGTMGAAGALLRISQSAVSKRIASLERVSGKKLIEKEGRRVVLTCEGLQLVDKIAPLIAEIRHELSAAVGTVHKDIQLGVSESVLASWGAKFLMKAENQIAPAKIGLHAHRGPLLTQLVSSGNYQAAIIAGDPGGTKSLVCIELGHEPMVILGQKKLPLLISIETQATTWQSIKRRAIKAGLVPDRFVESYFSAANLAIAGFGRALVPAGVALSLRRPPGVTIEKITGVRRPIVLLARSPVVKKPEIQAIIDAFKTGLTQQSWS